MPKVVARLKVQGKMYEIDVDLDEALKIKSGKGGDIITALNCNGIYSNIKDGTKIPNTDIAKAFGTSDLHEVAKQIIMKGEVQKTQEFRDAEKEAKIKQVIQLVLRNASDQHGRPYTEERIKRAIEEAHFHFDARPAEQQMPVLIEKLKEVIPIKIETKRIKITIPARFTGQVYGLIKDFKESEEWLANGNLQAILNIPSGMQIDFYDKLNGITHGAVQSEDLPEKK